ncbi:MAG: serine hydrolase [Kouleothrix sp.]|nr:serine hydrolase [Kouleothrix sp.]
MGLDRSAATGRLDRSEARLPYLPGLDGLRALAVVGVLLYHADLGVWGGFLGVESFFVLSGFLITALLLAEWRGRGRIDLVAFWARRARRLLPALLLVLAGTLALHAALLPGETDGLRGDVLATLGYVMNWHLVAGQQSYFDPVVRPSLLQHLWSLAVEEQFYLLWPPLFLAGVRYLRRHGLLVAALVAAATSLALMIGLFVPGADPSRVYYGTDTRAAGLLIGAALAIGWSPGQAIVGRRGGTLLDVAGLLALGGLLAAYSWLHEANPLLYRGGFALIALATAAVIAAATHPGARLVPGLLGWRPLRWIGLRSYGIYLWHWPIFMVTRPYQDVPLDGLPLLALRLALVIGLAALSYRLVELPIRHGALGRLWRALWAGRDTPTPNPGGPIVRRPALPTLSMVLLFTAACSVPPEAQRQPATPLALPTLAGPPTATAAASAITPASTAVSRATAPAVVPPEPTATTSAANDPTAIASSPAAAALEQFDPALAAKLQRILDQTVADGFIPGASLAVSIPGQKPWAGASGVRDRRSKEPIEPGTLVRIASISKVFTAVVVLQLAEEGAIDLDAPMSTWLPDLLPNGNKIAVRDLLQHTSGLYDYLEDRSFVNQAYRSPERTFTPRELVEYAAKFPPSFRPGAKGAWDYSSTNYVILGMIVEQATGHTLAQEMRRRIFDPLELAQTFFAPDEAIEGAQARGYSNGVDQTKVAMSFAFATANIVSTPRDVQRFAQALFSGELLEPATLETMLTFVGGKGQYKMPALEYGLGVMRNRLPVGPDAGGQERPAAASTVLGHIGGFGGFRSAVWFAPESGISVALGVDQAATDPNILATRVFDAILTHQGR